MTEAGATKDFDPNQAGVSGRLFGLPFDLDSAALIVLPVPWEVTVSYGGGTSRGPEAVLRASSQVDLFDAFRPDAWKRGIAMAPAPEGVEELGQSLRPDAVRAIEALSGAEHGENTIDEAILDRVNRGCEEMVARVEQASAALLDEGKLVGVLGGDHSVPLGLLRALAARHHSFGILHVDAHCDLRHAYEGFVHSHASIMSNALAIERIEKIVQVGVRDYCLEEVEAIEASRGRVELFDYRSLARRRFRGESWASLVESILPELPDEVYVSFDIDGLDPALCPGTGTPVPGGLQFEEAMYLVDQVVASGRRIVGFDLCEVSPGNEEEGEWDANVGSRVLYRLCCAAMPH